MARSGVPAAILEPEIRRIHQERGTSEYSYLISEVPSLVKAAGTTDPVEFYRDAIHAQRSARLAHTVLYDGVRESLGALRDNGVTIAAYTESIAYWSEWRIRQTDLDGVIDVLYSAPDHDLPTGLTFSDLRKLPADQYGL